MHFDCWEVKCQPGAIEPLLTKVRQDSPGIIVQIVRLESPPNPRALELIAAQTLAAVKNGSTLAEKPELDLLLRLAGTRQIGEAFASVGYKSKPGRFFMVAASEGRRAEFLGMSGRLGTDGRFSQLPRRELGGDDLDAVERAALLSAGI